MPVALLDIYPEFVPAEATATEPTNHWLVAPFTTVHPLAAKVAPFSNPPSPVGLISVVCALVKAANRTVSSRMYTFFIS